MYVKKMEDKEAGLEMVLVHLPEFSWKIQRTYRKGT